jgi:hypothetical protein
MHVSLHESGLWHIKVNGQRVVQWLRPSEFHPGFTRAVMASQPTVVAVHPTPAPAGTVIVPLTVDPADPLPMQFNVFIERPGADLASWPGKNAMGTDLVGRLPLATGAGTCVITSHVGAVGDASLTTTRPGEQTLEAMQRSAQAGTLHATMFSSLTDGAVGLLDGKILVAG